MAFRCERLVIRQPATRLKISYDFEQVKFHAEALHCEGAFVILGCRQPVLLTRGAWASGKWLSARAEETVW